MSNPSNSNPSKPSLSQVPRKSRQTQDNHHLSRSNDILRGGSDSGRHARSNGYGRGRNPDRRGRNPDPYPLQYGGFRHQGHYPAGRNSNPRCDQYGGVRHQEPYPARRNENHKSDGLGNANSMGRQRHGRSGPKDTSGAHYGPPNKLLNSGDRNEPPSSGAHYGPPNKLLNSVDRNEPPSSGAHYGPPNILHTSGDRNEPPSSGAHYGPPNILHNFGDRNDAWGEPKVADWGTPILPKNKAPKNSGDGNEPPSSTSAWGQLKVADWGSPILPTNNVGWSDKLPTAPSPTSKMQPILPPAWQAKLSLTAPVAKRVPALPSAFTNLLIEGAGTLSTKRSLFPTLSIQPYTPSQQVFPSVEVPPLLSSLMTSKTSIFPLVGRNEAFAPFSLPLSGPPALSVSPLSTFVHSTVTNTSKPIFLPNSTKHQILVDDAGDTKCHKKRKDTVDDDPLFNQIANLPELMSPERHYMCFTNQFLSRLNPSSFPPKRSSSPLLLCPPKPLGMTTQPLDLLKPVPCQRNVAGQRIILSLDQSGLSHRFIKRQRLFPPPDLFSTKLKNSQNLYFRHAAWFIECTNLHFFPRKGIGMAIAVITEIPNQPSGTTTKVELGFVLCITREHFIYAIVSDKVALNPATNEYLPGYLLLKPESTDSLTPHFLDGTFTGPYRMPTKNLVHTLNTKRFVFLNQIAGHSIPFFQSDSHSGHKKRIESCINETDGAFQCSYLGADHLLPPDWHYPFQKHDLYVQRTGDEIGDVDRKRIDLQIYEGQNNYFPDTFKPSNPTCNFRNSISLERHCKTTFVLHDSSKDHRLNGPYVTAKSWSMPRHTTSSLFFYSPYLGNDTTKGHLCFALISLSDLTPHFSSESYAQSPMSITDYDKLLSNISHEDIFLSVIDPVEHPGGFRICLCDPSVRDEVAHLQKHGIDLVNTHHPSFPVLKQVNRAASAKVARPILDWENNYTMPWLTVFRCFPWTRETGLATEDSLLFLNAYGDAFCDRDSVKHFGQTLYQGQRATLAVRLSPSLGDGEANRHQLYRERSYIAPMVPLAEKLGNKLFKSSSLYMRWMDPAVDSLLLYISSTLCQNTRYHYCRLKIITQGVPQIRDRAKGSWKDNLPSCLGWSSTDHCDRRDEYSKKIHEEVRKNIMSWKPKTQREKLVHVYLSKFLRSLGIGVPTCCGYEYTGSGSPNTGTESKNFSQAHLDDGSAQIHHYFVMSGLCCCMRLRPRFGNFFYAHTFAHCTSICVGTFEGNVYLSDSMFRTFAWGGSSN